ncbi:MAG: Gfo/Idh/MocA family oxidoreductase, partial [Actinomycetota bacterium]|nr:Gfo/Idh/MocA family oxidoreductase [Actinomycetota bacterium]
GAAVTVIYDFDESRGRELAAELDARSVASYQEVIDDHEVDAVLIASPDQFHAEQALACLAAGKPTLCEKPLAPNEKDAKRVLDAEIATGRRLIMMGFMRRFDPGYLELKGQFGVDGIGDPLIVRNSHRNEIAPYGLDSALSITNSAIHEIDINRWLVDDEYTWVQVITGRNGPLTPEGQHDPLFLLLQTSTGTIVDIEMFVQSQLGYEVRCDVTGGTGVAEMSDGSFVTTAKALHRGHGLPLQWLGRFQEAYRLQLQAWITHLADGTAMPGASTWDGYVGAVVATRAVESLRSGARVDIALPPRPALYG